MEGMLVEVLISFLVDLASNGLKVHMNFKERVWPLITSTKGSIRTSHMSLENHLRVSRDEWRNICQCRRLSGAGWDDATKTTLQEKTYEEYVAVM